MEPRVSVLIPARDAEPTLEAALRSVARQRESGLECVVVDDGSLDRTREVGLRFAAADPRFRVVAAARAGLVPALNLGLAACRAPFVARMDADDWMHRERLSAQLCLLEEDPSLSGVGCHVRLFPRRGLSEGLRAYERWLCSIDSPDRVRRDAFIECPLAHPTLVVRREELLEVGFRDAGWPEDYDLILRLLAKGLRIGVVPRRLLGWRDSPGRLSRTHPAYGQLRFTECKAAFLASGFLAGCEEYVLWGYGATGRGLRRALAGHGKRPSHIIELHPRRVGQRIHGAPVVGPSALPTLRGRPIVVSVAGEKPRAEIRAALAAMEFQEPDEFVCAA
ncbi:MAG TPA: glycosyl transferase family 2 [Deltaproteobacteria bacterium]|nr:glycosyl transferase family 2 [Deltaproteobacteria bacterium]